MRSKGFFWVAADHRVAYEWAQAGGVSSVNPMGMWWAALPREQWDHPAGERPDERPDWDPRFGDRQQTIVFIGQRMDEAELRSRLDACLLDEALLSGDSKGWSNSPNPFPPLQMVEGVGA